MVKSTAYPDSSTDALLADLCDRGGLPFQAYSRTSLLRRIRRRMEQVGAADPAAYQAVLASDPAEHGRLCDAVPVHRTEFFRDPDVWAYLETEIIPRLAAGQTIRAWSAGCATGEEAYSLAILLAEAERRGVVAGKQITVYATDISERAVRSARTGRFPVEAFSGMPPALRDRYFRPLGDECLMVRPDLRRLIVFARHDLIGNSPLGRMDLILCRNTLMYFARSAQAGALGKLYLGMRTAGTLITGMDEQPTVWTDLFRVENPGHRVYRPVGGMKRDALASLSRRRTAGCWHD